jgi:hypothetical protein
MQVHHLPHYYINIRSLKLSKHEKHEKKCVLRFLAILRLHVRLTAYDAPASMGTRHGNPIEE